MNSFGWRGSASLQEWLLAESYRFDFNQAARLLEMIYPPAVASRRADASEDRIRFRANVRFDFAASDVEAITPPSSAGEPAGMAVNFIGLAGAQSPLPPPLSELVRERIARGDFGLRDFLDIFNHRLIALLYRTARRHRVALTVGTPEQSPITRYGYAILGLGFESLRRRLRVDDGVLLYYAGLLCLQPRTTAGLERMLADHFQVPVRLQPMRGCWRPLAASERTELGPAGRNRRLGVETVLGDRIWDQPGKFELELGPMPLPQFLHFLPAKAPRSDPGHGPQSGFEVLGDLVRFYTGPEFDFSLRLKLRPGEIPEPRLGHARLGWSSWVGTLPPGMRDGEVCLEVEDRWTQSRPMAAAATARSPGGRSPAVPIAG